MKIQLKVIGGQLKLISLVYIGLVIPKMLKIVSSYASRTFVIRILDTKNTGETLRVDLKGNSYII